MADEAYLLEHIKDELCFVSADVAADLAAARGRASPFRCGLPAVVLMRQLQLRRPLVPMPSPFLPLLPSAAAEWSMCCLMG